jgi:hypothetical protein
MLCTICDHGTTTPICSWAGEQRKCWGSLDGDTHLDFVTQFSRLSITPSFWYGLLHLIISFIIHVLQKCVIQSVWFIGMPCLKVASTRFHEMIRLRKKNSRWKVAICLLDSSKIRKETVYHTFIISIMPAMGFSLTDAGAFVCRPQQFLRSVLEMKSNFSRGYKLSTRRKLSEKQRR